MLLYIVLALVQVLIENLPISSSGHIALIENSMIVYFFMIKQYAVITYYSSHLLNVAIIVIFLRRHVTHFCQTMQSVVVPTIFCRYGGNYALAMRDILLWQRIAVTVGATGITVVLYLFCHRTAQAVPLPIGFLITMLLLILAYYMPQYYERDYTVADAVVLGCAQGVALIPGVSRLAITVVVAQLLGMSRRQSFITSLFLQGPLMVGAGLLGIIEWYIAGMPLPQCAWYCFIALCGCMVALVVVGYWLLLVTEWLILNNKLYYCAWYLVIPLLVACMEYWLQIG